MKVAEILQQVALINSVKTSRFLGRQIHEGRRNSATSRFNNGVDAANGRGETFAVCLGCLRFRVKIFVFEVNVRSHFSIFV